MHDNSAFYTNALATALRAGAQGMRAIPLPLIISLLPACTTIVIKQGGEAVSVERRFGFASISLGNRGEAVLAEAQVWGVLASPMGFAVGYSAQHFAALDASCRLVLWVRSREDI